LVAAIATLYLDADRRWIMESAGAADLGGELRGRLRDRPIKSTEIARFLDGLSHAERVAAVRSLGRNEQRNLYEGVDGFRPLTLEDLVPITVADLSTVRHFGKNSLPVFTHFEKRFSRPRGTHGEPAVELYGFNFQSMAPVTGPGYFIARNAGDRPEVLVDYHRVPPDHPEGWPPIRSNERGLSRLVYGSLVDTLRGVSNQVSIGSAAKKGKDLGSFFVLCRQE
jgi:hypothetical protein